MRRRALRSLAGAALLLVGLTACTADVPKGAPSPATGDPQVVADIPYVPGGDSEQKLDACLPPAPRSDRPAIVVVHGGSFSMGDKASTGVRYVCTRLARAGYDAFSIDYRLLPKHRYPAALHDLQSAIEWLREDAQVKRFGLDPARIGAFGESAGAVLVAENGTAGSGSLSDGSRTRAVVALSTAPSFQLDPSTVSSAALTIALQYLGCTSLQSCPQARSASAIDAVDPSDPAFLLIASKGDWIPPEGSKVFASALQKAKVPVQLDIESGSGHGLQLVTGDAVQKVLDFYAAHL